MATDSSRSPLARADTGETCAICGKDAGSAAFCHYFHEGHRIVLCSPPCAETFLHRDDEASGALAASGFRSTYDREPAWWR